METVGSSEVMSRLPQLLERVAQGEEFTITEQGRPVARLVSISSAKTSNDIQAAVEAMKRFRQGRSLEGLSVREMIEEGRRF